MINESDEPMFREVKEDKESSRSLGRRKRIQSEGCVLFLWKWV